MTGMVEDRKIPARYFHHPKKCDIQHSQVCATYSTTSYHSYTNSSVLEQAGVVSPPEGGFQLDIFVETKIAKVVDNQ